MKATATLQQRQEAKRETIEQIKLGVSVRQASSKSQVPMHRATIYRLLKRVQSNGEKAFADGRHGHPVKLRGDVLTFLTECCQTSVDLSSPKLQRAIQQRFSLRVSVSQLNRVRASLGLTRKHAPREKKA